jgi:hypothetical protein
VRKVKKVKGRKEEKKKKGKEREGKILVHVHT